MIMSPAESYAWSVELEEKHGVPSDPEEFEALRDEWRRQFREQLARWAVDPGLPGKV